MPAMASPSSSSASPDPVTAPPPSAAAAAAANPPRPFVPSSTPLAVPQRPPIFTAQPLIAKPLNPPPPPPPPKGLLFSPNRGFTMRTSASASATGARPQPVDQMVTVANPAGYIRGSSPTGVMPFTPSGRPFVFIADHAAQVQAMRPPQPQPAPQFAAPRPVASGVGGGSSAPGHSKTVPIATSAQPKVASIPTVSLAAEFNNCKDRDKNREDSVVTIHGRKVRLLEGGTESLYALCRSWVRNGLPQENQPNFGEGVKLLPRPLPASLVDDDSSNKSGGDSEAEYPEQEEPVGSIEELSTRDLLQGLVKHSKRVRAKFRKERNRRIARYKQRLSLLLPPTI